MGIKNLNALLRNRCPHIYREINLSDFAYQIVSIDVSLFMCKFKTISENWVGSFINLITCLRKNDIHCVFIFDSGHPPEKIQEREERIQEREKIKARVNILEVSLLKYEETDVFDDVLSDLFLKIDGINHTSVVVKHQKIRILREKIEKKKRANFSITPQDWIDLRTLFNVMNVSYFDAPLEAETMCADLCKRGIVSAAVSDDTDVLAYGSDIFLTNINTYKSTAIKIEYAEMLSALNLTSAQFLDLCIMCGTDYNKNIPKVGCETAYKYITTYGSIEEVGKQKNLDTSILKFERSRELFTMYERYDIKGGVIAYNGEPNYIKLDEFLKRLSLDKIISVDQIKKCYKAKIIFQE